jgi:tryptophan synthase beta subunit
VHSVSAGLDYPGVGPEHAWWKDQGRVEYVTITDAEALDAFGLLARLEGILPALETAHAIAHVAKIAPKMDRGQIIIVNLSGRGDKDCQEVARLLERGTRVPPVSAAPEVQHPRLPTPTATNTGKMPVPQRGRDVPPVS